MGFGEQGNKGGGRREQKSKKKNDLLKNRGENMLWNEISFESCLKSKWGKENKLIAAATFY